MQHPPQSKEEIKLALHSVFEDLADYLSTLSEVDFIKPYQEKWSDAEHLAHLIMSAFPVANGLKQNKFIFRVFGTAKNGSRTFDKLEEAYKERLAAGQRADAKRTPSSKDITTKEQMLANWNTILQKLEERIEGWSESDLDKYRVPHPALGKITMREMLFFTVFHSEHHLDILKQR
ncbi:MAG: hypothetical protein ACI9VN_001552 [Patescibacteria group bacterium]|jgi:hypothetical protein